MTIDKTLASAFPKRTASLTTIEKTRNRLTDSSQASPKPLKDIQSGHRLRLSSVVFSTWPIEPFARHGYEQSPQQRSCVSVGGWAQLSLLWLWPIERVELLQSERDRRRRSGVDLGLSCCPI